MNQNFEASRNAIDHNDDDELSEFELEMVAAGVGMNIDGESNDKPYDEK